MDIKVGQKYHWKKSGQWGYFTVKVIRINPRRITVKVLEWLGENNGRSMRPYLDGKTIMVPPRRLREINVENN